MCAVLVACECLLLLGALPPTPSASGATTLPATADATDPSLPAGFQLVDYETGHRPYTLTNFAWLDDGGLLATGKTGIVTFVPVGGTPRVLAEVPEVRAIGDHGLLGLALANDYASTGRVYLAYDKGDADATGYGMVEEWTASPPADPTSFTHRRTVIDGSRTAPPLAQTGGTHAIDSVVVAPDDTLFVTIGDDALNNGDPRTLRAQDLREPYGKVLHVDRTGKGVPNNPFYSARSPASWRSRVYAYGFRNPFRLSLDRRSGLPQVGDVGWGAYEEIHWLAPGTNAGWPCYEGSFRTTFASSPVCEELYASRAARMPTWEYARGDHGAAVVAGFHYVGTAYPAAYRGSFFFGDYVRGQLWTMATDSAGNMIRTPESEGFASDVGGPVAFRAGPNGDVTYADLLSGTVRRLVYSEGNRAPVARLTFTTDPRTRTVALSAAPSSDIDGDEMTFRWDFGDGETSEGGSVTHRYLSDEGVRVTLTARDRLGAEGATSVTVHPANYAPKIVLEHPPGRRYAVGDMVKLRAEGTDREDGDLDVTWTTTLLHCPFVASCHVHPSAPQTGAVYHEPFTDHGADTTMVVTARVEDATGAAATRTYTAVPRVHTLSITSPVAVTVNGVTAAAAEVVTGAGVELSAPTTSSYWRFEGWSDGGTARRSLTMPDGDIALTATYASAIDRKYAATGGRSGRLGRPTTAEYDVAGGRARRFTGGHLYWGPETRVHEVRGAILDKYLAEGGPDEHGLPTTGVLRVAGGRGSTFTEAGIYWSSRTGAHLLRGALWGKYLEAGGPAGYGLPVTDSTGVHGGAYAHFTGGRSIFGSPDTGAHVVSGRIRRTYARMGYQRSCLGFPTSDVVAVPGGRRSRFAGGRITYWHASGAVVARCEAPEESEEGSPRG